jgi:hypothetical protein
MGCVRRFVSSEGSTLMCGRAGSADRPALRDPRPFRGGVIRCYRIEEAQTRHSQWRAVCATGASPRYLLCACSLPLPNP